MGLLRYYPEIDKVPASGQDITLPFMTSVVQTLYPDYPITSVQNNWKIWVIAQNFHEKIALTRRTVSILTASYLEAICQGNRL